MLLSNRIRTKLNYGLTGIVTMKKKVCTHIHRLKGYLGVKQPREVWTSDQAAQGCIQSGLESPREQRLHHLFSRLFQPKFPQNPIQAVCWKHSSEDLKYFISLACFISHRSCSAICLCKHQLTQEHRTVAGMCLFDHIISNKG